MKYSFIFILSILFLFNCNQTNEKKLGLSDYNKGTLNIYTDDAYKSVVEALADAYMINYPESKISVLAKKEDEGFYDFLLNKVPLVVMSRDLSKNEIEEYERVVDMKFQPSKFAADAVLFIVPKNSPIDEISLETIKKELLTDENKFIFDGANAGNLNFVAQKMGKKPSELKYRVIKGNENLIENISKYPDRIGVIGLNTISRSFQEKSAKLSSLVKILPISIDGTLYRPDIENIRSMTYPFTRTLYFISREANFGIANGYVRFSCTQKGQMVVQKEGLQPYNIYKREVQMR